MKPHQQHRSKAPRTLSFVVVTVSSSRYKKSEEGEEFDDESGEVAVALTREAGHIVLERRLVSDDREMIQKEIASFLRRKADVLLLIGGTGVAKEDVTIEAARPYFEKELEGFGELLRRESFDEVGAAAFLTRATAGVAKGKLLLCLPGSPGAVRTALASSISEYPHIVYLARLD